jgi:hypothetical protein
MVKKKISNEDHFKTKKTHDAFYPTMHKYREKKNAQVLHCAHLTK